MKLLSMFRGLAIAALLAGCATTQPISTERIVASQSAIRAAEEVGAGNDPQAALHLKLAREQVEEARLLVEDNKHERADMLLRRAEADAELALAMAREQQLQTEAQEAIQEVRELRQRTPNPTSNP